MEAQWAKQEVIPVSKRTYRATSVNDVVAEDLTKELRRDERVIVAVDIAKTDNKAAIIQSKKVFKTIAWKAPKETSTFVDLVSILSRYAAVEFVLESTGTYGDGLRAQMAGLGIPVYRVSTKHTHDAAELFDGVPSMHDAKAAHLLGWLHVQGRSTRWVSKTEYERDLAAAAETYEVHNHQFMGNLGRIEAKLARHFPELTDEVELTNASTLALIAKFGDPKQIAANAAAAVELMCDVGGPLLAPEKVQRVVAAAAKTQGMPMTAGERSMLMKLAAEANRQRLLKADAKRVLERLAAQKETITRTAEVVGMTTAAMIYVEAGDPARYKAPAMFVKALGLNLREKSSGKHQGQLKLTKRGPPLARKYLYLAALRLIQSDDHFKAWYARKLEREGGKPKLKAVIALMRKLAKALWHVARGQAYDATKLFDTQRLGLAG